MTPEQRLFNEAWEHIHKQGCPSVDDNGRCLYKSPEGLGCAFSVAIKYYAPNLEDLSASELLRNYSHVLHDWVVSVDRNLAGEIQAAHDDMEYESNFISAFEDRMRSIAERHDLTVPGE